MRNRRMLARILSVALAAGMSVSGLPVSAMAAEIEETAAQQEAVVEEEVAEVTEEGTQEAEADEQEAAVEAASGETAEEAVQEEEEAVEEETAEEAVSPEQEEQGEPEEEGAGEEAEAAATGETAEEAETAEVTAEETVIVQEAVEETIDLGVTGEVEEVNANEKVKEGWNQKDGDWYYYYDAESESFYADGIYTIGAAKYGFDWEGRMYSNERFYIYDYDESVSVYYRATSSGALFTGGWFAESGSWYYYGSDGKEYNSCKKTINNKAYYFDEHGIMLADANVEIDGVVYHADTNGVLSKVKDGLYVTDDGTYYVEKGAVVKEKWKSVNGKWYYFTWDGGAYHGYQWVDDTPYFFDPNGVMACNEWVHDYESTYYALGDGRLAIGEKQIGGKWYYFDENGKMKTGAIVYNGKTQLYGGDGVWIKEIPQNANWVNNGGTWYYVEDGELVRGQLKTILGKTYYFAYDGTMASNGIATDEDMLFAQDGARVEGGWYNLNGEWVYVDPSTHTCVYYGEKTINKKKYYFRDYHMVTGELKVGDELRTYGPGGDLQGTASIKANGWTLFGGRYYYYKDGKPFNGWVGDYYVSEGQMLTDTVVGGYYVNDLGAWVKTTGWTNGGWTYVKSNGKVAMNEWVQINGGWYYFDSYGHKEIYDTRKEGTKEYAFDNNGKLILTVDRSKMETKWVSVGGNWYYLYKGELVRGREFTIDGATYYFEYDGKMYKNGFNNRKYYGSGGKQCKYTGWHKCNGKWFWFNNNYEKYDGWLTVGGKTYYLLIYDGMATGSMVIGGNLYNFDSNGALVSTEKTQNGWVKKGSDWYYFKNGMPVSDGILTINGVTYGFTSTGKMAVNEPVNGYGGWYGYNVYFADGNGKIVFSKAWRKIDGVWYYFGEGGKLLKGLHYVDGKLYNLPSLMQYWGE